MLASIKRDDKCFNTFYFGRNINGLKTFVYFCEQKSFAHFDIRAVMCYNQTKESYLLKIVKRILISAGTVGAACCALVLSACAHAHKYGEWIQTQAPDCTRGGFAERVCACGVTEEKALDPLGHDLISKDGKPATCTDGGWTDYVICSRCDHTTYTALDPTGHDYAVKWSHDEKEHWHASVCGHDVRADVAAHTFDGGSVCTVCDRDAGYSVGLDLTLSQDKTYYRASCGTASGDIIIPDTYNGLPVSQITANGFRDRADVTSVVFGSNVSSVGERAFSGCTALTRVELKNVREIGEFAFEKTALSTVVVPNSVERISRGVFWQCESLTTLTVPFIGERASGTDNVHFGYIFGANGYAQNTYAPRSLETVTVTGGVEVGLNAFTGCAYIKNIELPDTVVTVDAHAFDNTNIVSATVPSAAVTALPKTTLADVTVICGNVWSKAFDGFTALKTACLRGEVKVISNSAFAGCSALESVELCDGVEELLEYAFMDCVALKSIQLPDTVTSVASYAFSGCKSVTALTLGNGLEFIGGRAFADCIGLTEVVIPDSVDPRLGIGSGAFAGCTALDSVSLPSGLLRVGDALFENCTSLVSINIPDTVTALGSAFAGCTSLKSVRVPDGVTSIGRGAFAGCSALAEITLPFVGRDKKTAASYSQYPFGEIFYARKQYDGCDATEQFYHNWDMDKLDGKSTYYIPRSLVKVTITGGDILTGAFSNCANIKEVTLGAGVNVIEKNAFFGCSALKSVVFGNASGWKVFSELDGAGIAVDVTDRTQNAAKLTDTFIDRRWVRV